MIHPSSNWHAANAIQRHYPPAMRHFIELIKVYIGWRVKLSAVPTDAQWRDIYRLAVEQTLVGICFAAVRRLPPHQRPKDPALYAQWLGLTARIQQQNELMDRRVNEALDYFRAHGFRCTILKGQGMARLYPTPQLRAPGDIDIWLDGGRERINSFSRKTFGTITGANYHHIHFPIFKDIEVEAHIFPGYFHNPIHNRRLRAFTDRYLPKGKARYPNPAFNRVYILQHCYTHLLGHGVGLRQLLDYHYVLLHGFTDKERRDTMRIIRSLGMERFAAAAMWVMREVFALDESFLLCEPDAREGRFLLSEIFHTGNMGHAETRFNWAQRTPLGRFLMNQRRNWHLLSHYPQEVLCAPFFSLVNYAWRWRKGLLG